MLRHREEVFADYARENFERILHSMAKRVVVHKLRSTERVIYEYEQD